jgi:lipopolysaccharide/colanic/teichoic acid biosynthesis glycosyltransferase
MNPPKDLSKIAVAAETTDVSPGIGVVATNAPRPPAPRAEVPEAPTRTGYRIAKRTLDLTASSVGLVVLSPLLAGIAAAVRLDSPGPILFRQERLGLGGRPFACFKFRTMRMSADQGQHQRHISRLIKRADGMRHRAWVPIEGDERVTNVGRFLRRSHLDELPQLLNIVRGDMSLVGPRPPIPYEVELYEPWHLRRLSVPPGLTGLWQVVGWGRLSFDEGVKLDIEYVERRSLGLDVRIILRTLWQIVRGRQF